jgi:hypothetical protein
VTKEQTGFPGKEILADYENERGASEKKRRHFHFNPATNLYGYRTEQYRTIQDEITRIILSANWLIGRDQICRGNTSGKNAGLQAQF